MPPVKSDKALRRTAWLQALHTLTGITIHHIHRDKQVNFGAGCAPLPLCCSDAMLGMMGAAKPQP
jgi:hypothetical protein